LLQRSKEFGFSSVRMQLQGRIFEWDLDPAPDGSTWQIRIALPDAQYVNVGHPFTAGPTPLAIETLVRVVEFGLREMLQRLDSQQVQVNAATRCLAPAEFSNTPTVPSA
jgi:hypothetical protein